MQYQKKTVFLCNILFDECFEYRDVGKFKTKNSLHASSQEKSKGEEAKDAV